MPSEAVLAVMLTGYMIKSYNVIDNSNLADKLIVLVVM